MSQENYKIVNFGFYCPLCVRADEKETNDICDECLTVPAREYSHKPERFQKKVKEISEDEIRERLEKLKNKQD